MKRLRVAMIAPPWLKIPPEGYGGVEGVIENLTRELVKLDVDVEIFGVKGTKIPGAKLHIVTQSEEFEHILKPMYDFGLPVQCAHVLNSLKLIEEDGNFDIIHDHNYFIGPTVLSLVGNSSNIPPAIHTIHGPPPTTNQMVEMGMPDNRSFWRALEGKSGCHFVPISDALRASLPSGLEPNLLNTVHNAIDVSHFDSPKPVQKRNHFITLARFCDEKGQATAVRLCAKFGYKLRMAGTVATINTSRKLFLELANPLSKYRNNRDFRYYSDKILAHTINNPKITYSGVVGGRKKIRFIKQAKALLFPINWEEPFGMAVIEALACGTPVIAMNRGAMPEIIEHGVTGFLADSEEEFGEYMERVDEIDPEACRQSVQRKFSANLMAHDYMDRYREVISKKTN